MGALSIRAGETARGREGLMAVSRGREAEGGSAREGWSAGEGGVGEANSVAKLPERRGVDGDLDGDARTMATLLERVLDGIFFFFTDGIHFTTSVGVALRVSVQFLYCRLVQVGK